MDFNKDLFYDTLEAANQVTFVEYQDIYESVEETEEFARYRATFGTNEENRNNIILAPRVLQKMASRANKTDDPVGVFRHHSTEREFPIGRVLNAKYDASAKETTGEFDILKDVDGTNDLIRRIEFKVVSKLSPGFRDAKVDCNIKGCGQPMYYQSFCRNGHYTGDKIALGDDVVKVTGTMKDGEFRELSVVGISAIASTAIFEENKELINLAFHEGVLDERMLTTMHTQFSVDLTPHIQPKKKTFIPDKDKGDTDMSNPTDADVQVLQDRITDLEKKGAEKDTKIVEFEEQVKTLVKPEDHNKTTEELAQAKTDIIEKDTKIVEFEAKTTDYDACVNFCSAKAIEFYAKDRKVDPNNTTDPLFLARKKALEESKSLSYLMSSMVQYMEDYYKDATQFGGQVQRQLERPVEPYVNPGNFDI